MNEEMKRKLAPTYPAGMSKAIDDFFKRNYPNAPEEVLTPSRLQKEFLRRAKGLRYAKSISSDDIIAAKFEIEANIFEECAYFVSKINRL